MFSGFSEETSQFLLELAFNNERSWFQAHREQYDRHLRQPFQELAADVAGLMQDRFPQLGLKLHVARIYRDARRLHGRGPYKEKLWFSLKNWEGLLQGPMFWFELGALSYGYGAGFYSPTAAQMELFRLSVRQDPAPLTRLARLSQQRPEFTLEGEDYRRPKGDLGPLLNPWYNKKSLGLSCDRDFGGELLTPALPRRLAEDYAFLLPFYEYFCQFYRPAD